MHAESQKIVKPGCKTDRLQLSKTVHKQRPGVKYIDYSEVKTRCKQRPGVNRKIAAK